MSKQVGQNTLCVHSAHAPEPATGALSQPIYLATTFERGADGGYPRGYRVVANILTGVKRIALTTAGFLPVSLILFVILFFGVTAGVVVTVS